MNNSFELFDGKLTVTTSQLSVRPEIKRNEEVLYIPQIPEMEPHKQMQFNFILKTVKRFKYYLATQMILCNIIHSSSHC